jgi:hypothetical protein
MWKKIGVCPDWQCDDRIWHAGLSDDGTKCFVSGFEDNVYIIWDILKQSVIWKDDGSDAGSETPLLKEWIDPDGCITLRKGSACGHYRVFGLNFNHPKIESTVLRQVLEVDEKSGILVVREKGSSAIVSRLPFDAFSGDWAFASFSENYAVIAVIEPYSVTFLGMDGFGKT